MNALYQPGRAETPRGDAVAVVAALRFCMMHPCALGACLARVVASFVCVCLVFSFPGCYAFCFSIDVSVRMVASSRRGPILGRPPGEPKTYHAEENTRHTTTKDRLLDVLDFKMFVVWGNAHV